MRALSRWLGGALACAWLGLAVGCGSQVNLLEPDALGNTLPCDSFLAGARCDGECKALLVDPDNCGACGHACGGGECRFGLCVGVVVNGNAGRTLIEHEGALLFTDRRGPGTITRVAPSTGEAVVLAQGQSAPSDLAARGDHVYWTDAFVGGVRRVALTGGQPEVVAEGPGHAECLAMTDQSLVWGAHDGATGQVLRAEASGAPTVLASGPWRPDAVRIEGDYVYWLSNPFAPTDETRPALRRAPLAGGAMTVLAYGGEPLLDFVVKGGYAYYFERGLVARIAVTGGRAYPIAGVSKTTSAIAWGGSDLYTTGGGSVVRISLRGLGLSVIADADPGYDIVVTDTDVFFTDEDVKLKRTPR